MLKDLRIEQNEIFFGLYGMSAGLFAMFLNMDPRGYFLVYSAAAMFGVMCIIMRGVSIKKLWDETKTQLLVINPIEWLLIHGMDQSWPAVFYVIGTLAAISKIKLP